MTGYSSGDMSSFGRQVMDIRAVFDDDGRSVGLALPQYRTVYLHDKASGSEMGMPDVLARVRHLSRARQQHIPGVLTSGSRHILISQRSQREERIGNVFGESSSFVRADASRFLQNSTHNGF